MFMGCFGVVCDGKEMALRDRGLGVELAGMEFIVGPVVERDAKVLIGGDAEGEGSACAKLVLAGGNGGHRFRPERVGDGLRFQERSAVDEMR